MWFQNESWRVYVMFGHFWTIFDLSNIIIWIFSFDKKLFRIELSFQNILNHPILILESKVMVKTFGQYQNYIFIQTVVAHGTTSKK